MTPLYQMASPPDVRYRGMSALYNRNGRNRTIEGASPVAQRTFSIIKPDAVRKGFTGAILAEIEKAGFKIVSIKKQSISKEKAKGFYHVHSARPFFDSLTTFMSGGPKIG